MNIVISKPWANTPILALSVTHALLLTAVVLKRPVGDGLVPLNLSPSYTPTSSIFYPKHGMSVHHLAGHRCQMTGI